MREIAAVKGIGVLWPGAGTLRGVFTDSIDGKRVFNAEGWENAIQQVLSACKEFKVPCGYPANATDIEMRMKQGFSVFVMNWGEAGHQGGRHGPRRGRPQARRHRNPMSDRRASHCTQARRSQQPSPRRSARRAAAGAQVPFEWRDSLVFHTFSIAAIDPRTGEVGVAVTTRVPCVGNGVPWVREGVGAVATQANTRTEYGNELLDALAKGEAPADALKRLLAADSGAASRQIGVIDIKGRSAQHTGTQPQDWKGHRAGLNYVTQGNVLVGPQVLDAVAKSFEASEGQPAISPIG